MVNLVLDWLEQAALRFPQKIAYQDEQNAITFSQILQGAQSIGSALLSHDDVQGEPVIVLSGRHVYTPVCYLGIVYAGGFYAPLDATMPLDRLNQCLSVVQAPIMIVDQDSREIAEQLQFSGKILLLEDLLHTMVQEEQLSLVRKRMTGDSPLYIIFTSGSTGVPKAVITAHRSLINYIEALDEVLHISQTDILGCQAPLDYIAAIRDIYFPLRNGASSVILPKSLFSAPGKLFDALLQYQITTICWSVSGLSIPASLGAFEHAIPFCVKKVCFSGSVMPCKLLRIWQTHLPDALFVNQYGPTEATASCSYYVVDHLVAEDEVLPIGIPYRNYKLYLITEDGRYATANEEAEIWVGGAGVTLGYYNSPERTATAFVQNPCNHSYREVLYRTGDLGKWREDGNLLFCGRMDRQIKHLGHRVELDEIDTLVRSIPGVSDCFTMYYKEKELLYCFYTGSATTKDIAVFMRKKVPAFMVPRKCILLSELPKLPNGKIDKQALQKLF